MNRNQGAAQVVVLAGLLLMAIALPIASRLVEDNQDIRNRAAGEHLTPVPTVPGILPTATPLVKKCDVGECVAGSCVSKIVYASSAFPCPAVNCAVGQSCVMPTSTPAAPKCSSGWDCGKFLTQSVCTSNYGVFGSCLMSNGEIGNCCTPYELTPTKTPTLTPVPVGACEPGNLGSYCCNGGKVCYQYRNSYCQTTCPPCDSSLTNALAQQLDPRAWMCDPTPTVTRIPTKTPTRAATVTPVTTCTGSVGMCMASSCSTYGMITGSGVCSSGYCCKSAPTRTPTKAVVVTPGWCTTPPPTSTCGVCLGNGFCVKGVYKCQYGGLVKGWRWVCRTVCAMGGQCRAEGQSCCLGTVPQSGPGCASGTRCVNVAPTATSTPTGVR